MQATTEALNDVRDLYRELFDQPPPEIRPESFLGFPFGVDPVQHAMVEAEQLKEIGRRLATAPRPGSWVPPADSFLTKNTYFIRVAVFGIPREDLEVSVIGDVCVVRGERKQPEAKPELRPVNLELPWGPFERRFPLPSGCVAKGMKARCVDGLLELTIPVQGDDAGRPSVIEIK